MTGTGLKKWRPMNRSALDVAAAISVTGRELVFDAKIVWSAQSLSSWWKSSALASRFSMIASTTISALSSSDTSAVKWRWPQATSCSESVIFSFSTARSIDFLIRLLPFSTTSSSTSRTITSNPLLAATSAIPLPIRPHPTTPTLLISKTYLHSL